MRTAVHQFSRFFMLGCIAVSVDYSVYSLLFHLTGPSVAKSMGFILGTAISYLGNRMWTFKVKGSSAQVFRFLVLYSFSMSANVGVNHLSLWATHHLLFSFLVATGLSMVINFIGQKFWVFTDPRPVT
ncbi:GtrA family protein [bacterium]|nr:GtrA family protein [bacterium]